MFEVLGDDSHDSKTNRNIAQKVRRKTGDNSKHWSKHEKCHLKEEYHFEKHLLQLKVLQPAINHKFLQKVPQMQQ
jgi:hypothetical protein